ncbi:heterokaryon incompatibility protein-domain-containing protein [Xylaria telfairii]|nr:heterokaryon incompatibility protein-domain-containing protein [Xylaria telfairii]
MSPYGELGQRETRLATILPGQWNDRIRCRLVRFSIDQAPTAQYKALSYVWGSPHVTEVIELQDENHDSTINLACAIRHIRNTERPVDIWIDALCINQSDMSEKSQQVALMRDIYAGAQEVVVFLGDGINHRIPRAYFTRPPPPPVVFWNDSRDDCHPRQFHEFLASTWKDESWNAFYTICLIRSLSNECDAQTIIEGAKVEIRQAFELLRRLTVEPWWQRIWVVQEIAIPEKVTIRYGNVIVPWELFVQGAQAMASLDLNIDIEHKKLLSFFARQVLNVETLRTEWKAGNGTNLLSLLQKFSDRKATDERDKVYALLGLANEKDLLIPDYSVGIHELYEKTVISLIKNHRSLAPLSGDLRRKNSQSQGLGSWVPDWGAIINESDRKRMALQSVYDACSGWRVAVFETADEYWNHVAEEIDLLVQDLQKPGRQSRRVAKRLREALVDYAQCLKEYMYFHQQIMESIPSYFQAYKRLTNKLQDESSRHPDGKGSKLSKDSLVGIPIKSFYDIHCEVVSENLPERNRIIEACRDLLEKNRLKDDPVFSTDHEIVPDESPRFTPRNVRRVAEAHTQFLESLELIRARPGPPIDPIDRICQSCDLLLELTEEGDIHDTLIIKTEELFNLSVIFRGRSSWMSDLRPSGARIVDGTFDVISKQLRDGSLDSFCDNMTLQTESESLAKVRWCGMKLTAWIDIDSGLRTVGIWMRELVNYNPNTHSWEVSLDWNTTKSSNIAKSFMRTLVGGVCGRAEGLDRIYRSDYRSLSGWFRRSLLPRLLKRGFINVEMVKAFGGRYDLGSCEKCFDKEMHLVTEGRVFFITGNGRMGLGPASMAPEDEIHVLPGGQTVSLLESLFPPFGRFRASLFLHAPET